jgi:hypothetical protein
MKNGGKHPGRSLWELWKDSLAASAAILTSLVLLDFILSHIFNYEHHASSIASQFTLQLPVVIFVLIAVPFATIYLTQRLTLKYTERRKRNLGLGLFIPAFIFTIIWFIAVEKWSLQGIWIWAIAAVLLILASIGWSMFVLMKPRQPEELPSKAKEKDEASNTPKHDKAKIIGLVALFALLLAIVLTRKKPK